MTCVSPLSAPKIYSRPCKGIDSVYTYTYTYTHMNATVYIRKENEKKWTDIADKSEWINTLLSNSDDTSQYGTTISTPVGPAVTVLSDKSDRYEIGTTKVSGGQVVVPPFKPQLPDPKTGYPCCLKARPCKHWTFDGTTSLWTNTITGVTKEAVV